MLSDGLDAVAKSLSAPVLIAGISEALSFFNSAKMQELAVGDKMANTVSTLMELEGTLPKRINEEEESGDTGFSPLLKTRLQTVRARIDNALE